jgi:hypothetical protein
MSDGHGEIVMGARCVIDGCSRPPRELGDHCTRCWLGLTPASREFLKWEARAEAEARAMDLRAMASWDIVAVAAAMLGG